MNIDDARLAPVPGDVGLACRFPGVILFCGARAPEDAVADLIDRCRRAASSPAPGGPLARQLAGVLALEETLTLPPFAMAARTEAGLALLVHGSVDVDVTGEGGVETLSGSASITWVDRLLTGNHTAVVMHPTGTAVGRPAPDVDLVEGVVAASGLRLVPLDVATAPSPSAGPDAETVGVRSRAGHGAQVTERPNGGPPPEQPASASDAPDPLPSPTLGMPSVPPPDPTPSDEDDGPLLLEDVEFESVLLTPQPEDTGVSERREPLPVDPDPAEIRTAESGIGEVIVQGVQCSRRHFNDPRSRFCSSCGISMVHETHNPVPGPRPPLGVIVFEDGTTYSLSSDYVVGRQPELDPRVLRGEALPLVLEDSGRTVSRAHAELRLVEWDVHFVNLSGTNGSFVWDTASGQWVRVTDRPVLLTPGTRIAMGRRTAVFESALVR